MKKTPFLQIVAASFLASVLADAQHAPDRAVHGDPYIPVGTLELNQTYVAQGVRPQLSWNIEYPKNFKDLAIAGPSGALSTTERVQAEIRILGVSFTDEESRQDLPVAMWVRVGGAGSIWRPVFYGRTQDVNPSVVLFKEWINPHTSIDLAARGQSPSGGWHEVVWTVHNSKSLVHLTNGSRLPDTMVSSTTGELKSFTSALLSADEESITIGPKDMAYFFELSTTDPHDSDFDLQDVVALVQFKTKNNNGHGNNTDGVDVSNPGQGRGGPNSIEDPSGAIDDEKRTSKRKS